MQIYAGACASLRRISLIIFQCSENPDWLLGLIADPRMANRTEESFQRDFTTIPTFSLQSIGNKQGRFPFLPDFLPGFPCRGLIRTGLAAVSSKSKTPVNCRGVRKTRIYRCRVQSCTCGNQRAGNIRSAGKTRGGPGPNCGRTRQAKTKVLRKRNC